MFDSWNCICQFFYFIWISWCRAFRLKLVFLDSIWWQ
jgi:hypothetical protein